MIFIFILGILSITILFGNIKLTKHFKLMTYQLGWTDKQKEDTSIIKILQDEIESNSNHIPEESILGSIILESISDNIMKLSENKETNDILNIIVGKFIGDYL